jgi:uncharacterized membrane protein YjdF
MLLRAVRRRPALAAYLVVLLVASAIFGGVTGARLTTTYVIVVGVFVVVLAHVDERFDLGTPVLLLFALWGTAHLAGGLIALPRDRVLYNAILGVDLIRYDRLVHLVGFGTATYACGVVLMRWMPMRGYDRAVAVMAVLAGMGIGGLNEMAEFITTLIFPDSNVGGFTNTGWDLVSDFVGALLAAGLLARWRPRRASGTAPMSP